MTNVLLFISISERTNSSSLIKLQIVSSTFVLWWPWWCPTRQTLRRTDRQTAKQKASQNHSRTEEDAELKLWNQLFPWENPDKMNPRPHLFLEITAGRTDTRHGWKQLIMTTIHSCLFHLRRMCVSQPTAPHVRIMMRNGWVNVFD